MYIIVYAMCESLKSLKFRPTLAAPCYMTETSHPPITLVQASACSC